MKGFFVFVVVVVFALVHFIFPRRDSAVEQKERERERSRWVFWFAFVFKGSRAESEREKGRRRRKRKKLFFFLFLAKGKRQCPLSLVFLSTVVLGKLLQSRNQC